MRRLERDMWKVDVALAGLLLLLVLMVWVLMSAAAYEGTPGTVQATPTGDLTVTALAKEQLEACKAKGAIIDADTTGSPPQSIIPPIQVSTPPPNTDGSNSTSSKPSAEP